ncbi:MAG: ABC transporter ATP-binding protein [Clostridiales bacterium]|nr:ABC transporter ATP-binding protein [Clostridiales bacterium]
MDTLLEINNLSIYYQTKKAEIQAINNISFKVRKGEFIAIIGKSGCGKTSILSAIASLIPYEGKIIFYNKLLNQKATSFIGYMLQRDELFPWLTIEQNTLLPLKIKKMVNEKTISKVSSLLKKYGLESFQKSYPNQLSGGMRQRAALIRTLSFSPDLLLLDEPFSALDYQTRLSVCDDVYSIIKKENKTAILVTHDISEAISVADKIIVLTERPATILNEHIVDLDKSLTPLKRREQKEFAPLFEKIWEELHK